MARQDPLFNLRIPETLKNALQESAEKQHRSLTSEIVVRLQQSFDKEEAENETARWMREAAMEFRSACVQLQEAQAPYRQAAVAGPAPVKRKRTKKKVVKREC